MAEYIEKKTAIDAVESVPAADWLTKRYTGELERIPPSDVRPVVRGRWKRTSKSLMACSVCGNCVVDDRISGMFFCPNCGADMRGDEDG